MWFAARGIGMPLAPVSAALIAIPLAASRTMLLLNVTYSVTHQVHRPSWFTDFSTIAVPFWPDVHTRSNVLPSTRTRRAFFSSKAFFAATPDDFHESRLVLRLRRISMSDG